MSNRLLATLLGATILSGIALGQTANVTGKILAVSPRSLTIQKGREIWEVKRTNSTKVDGPLKVGSTLTVTYNPIDAHKKEAPVDSDKDPGNTAFGAQKKE